MLLPALLVALASAAGPALAAQEPSPPSEATVFIRVVGVVRAEFQRGWKQVTEKEDVEIATGSGFVVSPAGYVLTSHHVVRGEEVVLQRNGEQVRVKAEVTRIEVVLPADGTRLEAHVEAGDPDLDLAVLSVSAHDLPFVALGDSDALEPGQAVQVIGFPYGRNIETGRAVSADTVPQPSLGRGTVSALRASDEGEARFIQTDAAVYPGNSGGPVLDADGYAVGVVKMVLTRRSSSGAGPAFAVPINLAKDFLASSGLERIFPARRLRLGPVQSFDWKRIRFRLPDDEFDDTSPSRLRVEWRPPQDVEFVVDRVASPLALAEVEESLLAGRDFSTPPLERIGGRPLRIGGRSALVGRARTGAPSHRPSADVGYAIVDLGKEKVVARYMGPPAQTAFNRSVLEGWLASLEADPLLTAEVAAPVRASLEPALLASPGAPPVALPQAWSREPGGASRCETLPAPDARLSASPEGDFTIVLSASWWLARGPDIERAVAGCPGTRTVDAPAAARSSRLGLGYTVQRVPFAVGEGLLQLEMEAPTSKEPFVRDLFAAWVRSFSTPASP